MDEEGAAELLLVDVDSPDGVGHWRRLGQERGTRPVVAVCLRAHRSVPAVRLLTAHGWSDARQLAGGMTAWRRENLPER